MRSNEHKMCNARNPTSSSFPPVAAVQHSKVDLQSNVQMFKIVRFFCAKDKTIQLPLDQSLTLQHDQEDDQHAKRQNSTMQ